VSRKHVAEAGDVFQLCRAPRRPAALLARRDDADIAAGMAEADPQRDRRVLVWLGGSVALGAWFAMLWLMFGDVL
jgi:hypothetical protein